ncbi:unnamed protein product [Lymnaea stagnalis]|uniref:Uncharacterized protein n=1 Tax=Lymnaea stagnalis TaxID=6523 RepID=A0AAV2I448_LYMST
MAVSAMLFLVVLSTHCGCLMAQKIHIFKMRQEDCQTKCTSGLLASMDKCGLHYSIVFDETVPDTASLTFQIMNKSSDNYASIFDLRLITDCIGFKESAALYCTQTDVNVFNITINATSLSNLNEAKIRAYYSSDMKHRVYSEIQTLPRMYEPTDATGILSINGRNISNEQMSCYQTIKTLDLVLEFTCYSPATPCVIEIQINNSTVAHSRDDYAVFKEVYESRSELFVDIKFASCSLGGRYNTIGCTILMMQELKQSSEEGTSHHVLVISITVSIVLIIVMATAIVFVYR